MSDQFDLPAIGGSDPKTCAPAFADEQQALLSAIASGCTMRAAAVRAGVDLMTAHGWLTDDSFAAAFQAAEAAGTDVIEDEAFRRAVKGVEKPVYRAGEVVGHVADYSDTMLMFLLKARRPDRYGPASANGKAGDKHTEPLADQLNLKAARDEIIRKFTQVTAGRAP